MSNLSVGFIRASVTYLLLGITFGAIMAFPGGFGWLSAIGLGNPLLAHVHANLLGFMVMMVIGVAYHIFPRFTGNPVKRMWMAWANFWGCQVGTAGMVLGFFFQGIVPWLLPAAALVEVFGLVCFVLNMYQVVRPLKPLKPALPKVPPAHPADCPAGKKA